MTFELYYNAHAGNAPKLYPQVLALYERCTTDARITALPLPFRNVYIVLGGDGTFNTLLNELPKPEEYLFVLLPGGTSNSLYSQISPNEDPLSKLERLIDGPAPVIKSLDLPQIEVAGKTYRFINEASAGFAAAIAREVEQRHTKRFFNRLRLNELAYIATAFRCWCTDEPYFLSFCNNRRISGDLYPCVNADPTDGILDIYELKCPRWRLPFELTRLVKAGHDKPSPFVSRRRTATNSQWHFGRPLPVEIDGNPLPPAQEITLSWYPKKIQVL